MLDCKSPNSENKKSLKRADWPTQSCNYASTLIHRFRNTTNQEMLASSSEARLRGLGSNLTVYKLWVTSPLSLAFLHNAANKLTNNMKSVAIRVWAATPSTSISYKPDLQRSRRRGRCSSRGSSSSVARNRKHLNHRGRSWNWTRTWCYGCWWMRTSIPRMTIHTTVNMMGFVASFVIYA